MDIFEITKRGRRPNYSFPNSPADQNLGQGTIQTYRGVAFQESLTADTTELANGLGPCVGFVTRNIASGGPDLGSSIYPGRIDLPTVAGQEASYEDAEEVEAECASNGSGNGYYICGTGARALTNTTPLRTPLSFDLGRFCVAQTGQLSEWELVAVLTATDSSNPYRLRMRRVHGHIIGN